LQPGPVGARSFVDRVASGRHFVRRRTSPEPGARAGHAGVGRGFEPSVRAPSERVRARAAAIPAVFDLAVSHAARMAPQFSGGGELSLFPALPSRPPVAHASACRAETRLGARGRKRTSGAGTSGGAKPAESRLASRTACPTSAARYVETPGAGTSAGAA